MALVEYLTGGATATATASLVVNLAPRGTAALDDIGGSGGLNVSGTIGGLRISSASQLVATSRIYADLRAADKGTLGNSFRRSSGPMDCAGECCRSWRTTRT